MSDGTSAPWVIRIRGLVTRAGDRVLHDDIDLDALRGEILGVVGGSGTGKPVLLRSIIGPQRPAEGNVEVLGKNIAGVSDELLRLQIRWGVLFQDGALFSDQTVAQNVQLPLPEHTDLPQKLMDEIASVGFSMVGLSPDFAKKLPLGVIRRHAQTRWPCARARA